MRFNLPLDFTKISIEHAVEHAHKHAWLHSATETYHDAHFPTQNRLLPRWITLSCIENRTWLCAVTARLQLLY